jgi:ABC-type nitrate/sulfonate/bicarbonate transport system substrate-binding protein
VTPVPVAPDKAAEALETGAVDAMLAFQEHAYAARQRLGPQVAVLKAESNIDHHWLLVTREPVATEPITRVLRALANAQRFLLAHPEEGKAIVQRTMKLDPEWLDRTPERAGLTMNLGLSQSLLTSLETFARWRMARDGRQAPLPNFLDVIDPRPLETAMPSAISLFR